MPLRFQKKTKFRKIDQPPLFLHGIGAWQLLEKWRLLSSVTRVALEITLLHPLHPEERPFLRILSTNTHGTKYSLGAIQSPSTRNRTQSILYDWTSTQVILMTSVTVILTTTISHGRIKLTTHPNLFLNRPNLSDNLQCSLSRTCRRNDSVLVATVRM